MLKNILISGAFLALGTIVTTPQTASAQVANPGTDLCSAPTSQRIVLEQEQILLSHDEGGAFIGPVATSIPAGTYELSTTSFEQHIGSSDPTQDNETWFINGYFEGVIVYTSPATTDIPDGLDTISDNFGQVTLPEIDAVEWVHNAFPDPTYQSVYASCIEFEVVDMTVDVDCTVATVIENLKVTADVTVTPADQVSELTYDWGDNTVETLAVGEMAMHTYDTAETYTVTVTTNNLSGGETATCSTEVTVTEAGAVLGDTTDDEPTTEEAPAETGAVLGSTSDGAVLAETGVPAIASLLVGTGIAATAIITKRTV